MEATTGDAIRVYRTKMDGSGRIVLPSEIRNRQHIRPGDEVLLRETDAGVEIRTLEHAIREAQEVFARLAPPEVLLSEELIRDRREEAARE